MELIEELSKKFKPNMPILVDEIYSVLSKFSYSQIYKQIAKAVVNAKLVRYDKGVYYIPTITELGLSKLNPQLVIEKKYIASCEDIFRLFSGTQLLNLMGLSNQVPIVTEIITNKVANGRKVKVGYLQVILKKPRIEISASNVDAYTVLELFNNLNLNNMPTNIDYGKVVSFIKDKKLKANDILMYADYFPARAVKNLVNSGVLEVLQ